MSQVSFIDAHVGGICREMRGRRGISAGKLATHLSISEERLAAMEEGRLRIGAADLFRISTYLNAPVAAFFKGLDTYPGFR